MSDCKCGRTFAEDAELCAECAAEAIERLTAEVANVRAIVNLANEQRDQAQRWFRDANRRIEELEQILWVKYDANQKPIEGRHIITTDKIDAAWKRMKRLMGSENTAEHFMGRGIEAALRQDFHIVECKKCGGSGEYQGVADHDDTVSETDVCIGCDGHRWTIRGGE